MFESRIANRQKFAKKVDKFMDKMQVGARGSKIGQEWIAIDLFDKSDLIDFNYDLQNLPFEDNCFDCIVCNAVLEHIQEAELAIYEMYRVLRPGGQIWVEVPFLQAYHAHPHDFWRCTLPGIRRWFTDFDEVQAGIFEGFEHEAKVLHEIFCNDLKIAEDERNHPRKLLTSYVNETEKKYGYSKSLYMATYYWGEKPKAREIPANKKAYLEYLKEQLVQNNNL